MGKRAQQKRRKKSARRLERAAHPARDAVRPTVHGQIPRAQMSMRAGITAVPIFPDGREANPAGEPGEYTCIYVLGKPGAQGYVRDIDFEQFANSGASLLVLPPGISSIGYELNLEGNTYEMLLEANAEREAARVKAKLNARDLLDAEALAYDYILPIVSLLGFKYDVGVEVRGWVLTEVATGVQRARLGLLGEARTLRQEAIEGNLTQEARMLLATYREASSSSSLFLQALSYWKVVEGVYALRERAGHEAIANGHQPPRWPRERIPADLAAIPYRDTWALDGFQPFLGKRFTVVRDELRDRLRVGLAHLLPGDKNVRSLTADVYSDLSACEAAIPVLRYVARTLLESYLAWPQMSAP